MNDSTLQLTRAGLSALRLTIALLVTSEARAGQETNRGQGDTPRAEAPVLRAAPVPAGQGVDLDGHLSEPAWQTATPITEFTQQDPVEGAEATEASEIRILMDDAALYIGAMFFDDSDGILAYQKRRDESLGTDDRFDTSLFRLNAAWDVSPWSSVTGNVQYDDVSEIIGLFLKARWIIAPGNDLFLVYTQNWRNLRGEQQDRRFTTLSQGGSTKLNYTFQF